MFISWIWKNKSKGFLQWNHNSVGLLSSSCCSASCGLSTTAFVPIYRESQIYGQKSKLTTFTSTVVTPITSGTTAVATLPYAYIDVILQNISLGIAYVLYLLIHSALYYLAADDVVDLYALSSWKMYTNSDALCVSGGPPLLLFHDSWAVILSLKRNKTYTVTIPVLFEKNCLRCDNEKNTRKSKYGRV